MPTPGRQLRLWDDLPPRPAPAAVPAPLPAADAPGGPAGHDLNGIFARVFRRLRLRAPEPEFQASFEAFAGLRSTVRLRPGGRVEARVSDLLAAARPLVLEALAEILLTRLFRLRTSREARECYRAWAHSPAVAARIDEVRRERGRKVLRPPRGAHFDLRAVFDDLNVRFFAGSLSGIRIGWSPVRSRTMLGHYDNSHRTITITRWLDRRRVPRYVVEYLVFHEMLHARIPVEHRGQRRLVHPPAFLAAERSFPEYARATRWLGMGRRRGAGEAPWESSPSG